MAYLMGLIAFIGFFLAFSGFPAFSNYEKWLNPAGYLLLIAIVAVRVYGFDLPFSVHRNDIIILLLANMALFGGVIWLFTRNNWYLRLGIMGLYFAWRLTHQADDSINRMLWDFTPMKWIASSFPAVYEYMAAIGIDLKRTVFYHPEYLKYLMIVIPGSIAGDLVYKGLQENVSADKRPFKSVWEVLSVVLLFNLIFNLWGLQSRNLMFVWIMNVISLTAIGLIINLPRVRIHKNFFNLLSWSIFWLLLGLVFEAWQGGIKKDSATISYFFLTSGLAGFMIAFFKIQEAYFLPRKWAGFVGITGMNPMTGYVAASYFVMPLLFFAGILPWMDNWHLLNPWLGVLRGVVLTCLMILVVVATVKHKYFWKT
jgi:hypothetical protein